MSACLIYDETNKNCIICEKGTVLNKDGVCDNV